MATPDPFAERTEGEILSVAPFPTTPPPGFSQDRYDHTWRIARPRDRVWDWLCDPSTFVDGQIPPWRVEFLTNDADESGFARGVYNAHVGPLMSFSGVLGDIEEGRYRDLQYFYGSFAVSHALFRPTRLQFWLDDDIDGSSTVLHLRVDAYVRNRAIGLWRRSMALFWRRFGNWCEKAVPATG
ncbi:MAG: hypothetical protein AAF962_09825 [Actinomycetota bacterium]